MSLTGPLAFAALQIAVRDLTRTDDQEHLAEPVFERLRVALRDSLASPLDRAVLMRQALLFETNRRGGDPIADFRLSLPWDVAWEDVGFNAETATHDTTLTASPWTPAWLDGAELGVDVWATEEHLRRFDTDGVDGDPFLSRVGYRTYRSRRQRGAARAVLTTPPGETLAVVLATGEGKSLLFRLIDAVGFAGEAPDGRAGVTLVVVPTIALAIDQSLAMQGNADRAWQGGSDRNSAIAEAVRSGAQGLFFASPEAACGRLRVPLLEAARAGALRAIVIDEAHMVDAWGTGFRTEFQSLSGLQSELLAASPESRAPRTICLSATLSDAANETLSMLFAQGTLKTLSAASLRPEPDYWFGKPTDEDERRRRVIEALHHVPRPAILYVSRVADAVDWGQRLRDVGFRRLRIMHGGTPTSERESVLAAWRDGALDLVVATSAFGLGVNNEHVRSVIHACVPESLDRYYQEVGRGGRDGRSCLSLVIPALNDFTTAQNINNMVVVGLPRGLERWSAMFNGPKLSLGQDRFALRLDIPPGPSERDIDMIGEMSTDWNARLLTLMSRSGIIRLLGQPETTAANEPGSWQTIEIIEHNHLHMETWERRVAPTRTKISLAKRRNLALMNKMIASNECPANLFCELYRDTIPVCSRCSACRNGEQQPHALAQEVEPAGPWRHPGLHANVRSLFDHANRLVVTLENTGPLARRQLSEVLIRLAQAGMWNVLLYGDATRFFEEAISSLTSVVAFVARNAVPGLSILPAGPEILLVGENVKLSEGNLGARSPGEERILFVSSNMPSPQRPNLLLSACYDGRMMTLAELHGRTLL